MGILIHRVRWTRHKSNSAETLLREYIRTISREIVIYYCVEKIYTSQNLSDYARIYRDNYIRICRDIQRMFSFVAYLDAKSILKEELIDNKRLDSYNIVYNLLYGAFPTHSFESNIVNEAVRNFVENISELIEYILRV